MSTAEDVATPASAADRSRQLNESLDSIRKYFYEDPIEINGRDRVLVDPRLTATVVLPHNVRYLDSLYTSGTRFTFGLREAPTCKHGTRSLKEWRSQKGKYVVAWVCAVEPWAKAGLMCQPVFTGLSELAGGDR